MKKQSGSGERSARSNLPPRIAAAKLSSGRALPKLRAVGELRVLLLDQDARAVSALRRQVRNLPGAMSVSFQSVAKLAAALGHLAGHKFDAILISLCVSDVDVLTAVREVHAADAGLPIIVTTPSADEPTVAAALAAGADDFLEVGLDDGALLVKTLRYAIERKHTSRHLAFLSQFDKLTGLANRELFRDCVQQALRRAEHAMRSLAVISLDVDRFKAINESFGHGAGDELLVTVAYRLSACVRKGDTIARTGSDEFAILLENLHDQREVERLCQKILNGLSEPIFVRGEEIAVTASIGVSFCPGGEAEVADLLRRADNALNRAKKDCRGRFCVFTEALQAASDENLQMESALRRAIGEDALFLCYQPKLCLQTGQVVGAEALLRWRHPRLGVVMPTRFVPLAEECGLIVPIGEWVLRRACQDLRRWRELGFDDLTVAVNLSTQQFRHGGLGATVERVLEETGADPNQLVLEITESLLLDDDDSSRSQLDALKAMGIAVYLDDFGTGYSSLSYLKRFRIDGLKIDRSFVHDLPGNPDEEAITRAIIALGRALRLGVIAEGVESREQLELLLREGCDAVQGYLFSAPLPFDEFVAGLPAGFGRNEVGALASIEHPQ
ncbi:MAG: GGDEF domain-containing response regulator [Proteobacteria bacterium]|nr:GGDEF domain-containing response regulator [Pseudomonadota bacterium]